MGLFKSTIQSLSEMAIQESGTEIPQAAPAAVVDEFLAELKSMPTLNEQEMAFPAYAVPIRESSRLRRYLIETEDLARFMASNHIDDLLEAIGIVAEANKINLTSRNLALVIDEAAILQEAEELGFNIGANTNDGAIGSSGLLGPHTDIHKFRRFANSKELIDTVTNKYGIPIVKKHYNIGLVDSKRKDISHNGEKSAFKLSETGTANADTEIKPEPGQQVINEKPASAKLAAQPTSPVTESAESVSSELQYLRDIANGKYDDQL